MRAARARRARSASINKTRGENKGPSPLAEVMGRVPWAKVVAPSMACKVIDWAIQVHGSGGLSDDFPLAAAYANARAMRFLDGPDEVHRNAIAIAKVELSKY